MRRPGDKTNVQQWDENWRLASSSAIRGDRSSPSTTFVWPRIKRSLDRAFVLLERSGGRLIEIGAGGSEWLPLLRIGYGFDVCGLDYSVIGCDKAREIMEAAGLPGKIIHGDMFAAPDDLIGTFDVVASFGLIEHFEDTPRAIAACAKFAKPGGLVVTMIPNMAGLYGWAFKFYDKKAYDGHVPMTLSQLTEFHRRADLEVLFAECLFGLPGVIDGARLEANPLKRAFRWVAHRFTKFHWLLESRGLGFPENSVTSPYLLCVARNTAR